MACNHIIQLHSAALNLNNKTFSTYGSITDYGYWTVNKEEFFDNSKNDKQTPTKLCL